MCVVRRNTAELDVWHLKAYVSWKTEVYGVHVVRGTPYYTCTLFTDTRVSGLYCPSPTHLTPRHGLIGQLCVVRGTVELLFFRYLYIYYWVAYILKDLKTNFCSVHHAADHSNLQKNYYDQIISIHCYYQVFSGLKNNILHE